MSSVAGGEGLQHGERGRARVAFMRDTKKSPYLINITTVRIELST